MGRFVITGSSGTLGQRVQLLWLESQSVDSAPQSVPLSFLVAVDQSPVDPQGPLGQHYADRSNASTCRIVTSTADLASDDLGPVFHGADVVVHLATVGVESEVPTTNSQLAERVLRAASEANAQHVVVVSSAVVYGAWPDNPVPLTEDAPIRPNEGFAFADDRVSIERLAVAWKAAGVGRTLTILRPAASISSAGNSGWLANAVWPARVDQFFSILPPVQFVHVDDVASAVLHAVNGRLDGVYNVAPDRWLRGEDAPALMGTPLSIPATGRAWEFVSAVIAFGVRPLLALGSRPDGALPWSHHPWVVANDRLKATGWAPLSTTEEVIVSRRAPSKLALVFARKRQEVTIVAVGGVGMSIVTAVLTVLRRRGRR